MLKWFITCIIGFITISLAGCGTGDGLNRQAVSGEVTWNGAPLERGIIRFEPLQSEAAVVAEKEIVNGAYSIEPTVGLVPGEYRVLIFSPETPLAGSLPPETLPGESFTLSKERIPARYNADTTLRATVTDGGKNLVNFTLSSKEK